MSNFKTQQEIYKALLDGKKLSYAHNDNIIQLHPTNGMLVNQDGLRVIYEFKTPSDFSLYTEPKPKVVLYEYLVKESNGWSVSGVLSATDEEAKKYHGVEIKRTGRSFEVECG